MGKPNPILRQVKMMAFFLLGLYSSIVMWKEAANTFATTPNFAPVKPTDRCIGVFSKAETYAKKPNTMAAYAANAGRYRWGFCTDLEDDVLDAEFGAANLYDALSYVTGGTCNLKDSKYQTDRENSCARITGMPAGTTCKDVIETKPTPYGVMWAFAITKVTSNSKTSKSSSNSTFTTTIAPGPLPNRACTAEYTKDDDIPPCTFKNARFYGTENKWVSGLYITATLLAIGLWFYEIWSVWQFSNQYGAGYGNLEYYSYPEDGTWGAPYEFYRVYLRKLTWISDPPDMTWIQFGGAVLASVLAQLVALVGIVGCDVGEHLLLLIMFVLTTIKLLFDIVMKIKELVTDDQMTAEELVEMAHDIPLPPGIDPSLNHVVQACCRAPNPGTIKQYESLIEASPSRTPYRYALTKICTSGTGSIGAEITRISDICRHKHTDPAIHNICITWLQILSQCQNFMAGGNGMYAPPAFPKWRDKVAPQLAAAHAEVAAKEAEENGETPLLQIPGSPVGSPMNQPTAGMGPMASGAPPMLPAAQAQFNPATTPPSQQWPDGQNVSLAGMVQFATYGPQTIPCPQRANVTMQVNGLLSQGRNHVVGGIHTVLGDNAPGQAKVFSVWYAPTPQQQMMTQMAPAGMPPPQPMNMAPPPDLEL